MLRSLCIGIWGLFLWPALESPCFAQKAALSDYINQHDDKFWDAAVNFRQSNQFGRHNSPHDYLQFRRIWS